MAVDANSREEAVRMLQGGMTQAALDQHMSQFHKADEQKPTLAQTHAMIEQILVAV